MDNNRSKFLYNKAKSAMMQLREISCAEGNLTPGVKAVISAAIFSVLRCEPCVKSYLVMAKELGANIEDVMEVFALVINSQGCAGDLWAGKAINFFKGINEGTIDTAPIMADLCEAVNLVTKER